jgi:hypothetical protein
MQIRMQNAEALTGERMQEFLKGSEAIEFKARIGPRFASASDTRQNLSATQVRQNPVGGPLSPRASGPH